MSNLLEYENRYYDLGYDYIIGLDDELGVVISQAVGNDYIVNYGQTINPEVKEGSFVEAGQTIAYVNQPTKYYSKEGDNIYFSVERNGKTKDPLNYIDYED